MALRMKGISEASCVNQILCSKMYVEVYVIWADWIYDISQA